VKTIKTYNHKAINCNVITVDSKDTTTGKFLATARVRDTNEAIWICKFWDVVGRNFIAKNMLYQKIYVEGSLQEDNSISVKFFDGKEISAQAKHVDPNSEESKRTHAEYLERHNMVMIPWDAGKKIAQPKRFCVKVNGRWEEKLEYCMRIMGVAEATDWLRVLQPDGSFGKISLNPADFKVKLDAMLRVCQENTGDFLEYFEQETI